MSERNISIFLHTAIAAVILASYLSGCTGGDSIDGNDGLPIPGRQEAEVACSRLCTIDAAACNITRPCADSCKEQLHLVTPACLPLAETWYTCLASYPAICLGDGTARHTGCDAEGSIFIDCILL